RLTTLYLRRNSISDFSFLRDLKGLTTLDLSRNRITQIPPWLASGRLSIKIDDAFAYTCINLYENPIKEPLPEIVHQGNSAILSYYSQLTEQGQDRLYEAKMLIVGEGEAGKT
ncbi:leucine-rich repeat domain-containing protein, partial [Acaryochloris marina NIES-2412]|uniref:leucine-rich repeat domain-containing protein n=1 Tax=Acaryochloris marina TaxID=155978 RepID=UPI004057F599